MSLASVTLKPGVLFVATPSGGTLMDVTSDKYLALSPVSALIWNALTEHRAPHELIDALVEAKGFERSRAEMLLKRQLETWEKASLVNAPASMSAPLPRAKASLALLPAALDANEFARAPLRPSLLASLCALELSYRRTLRKSGLAAALVRLQSETPTRTRCEEMDAIRCTVRAYYALRRPFRQGRTATDCLPRSIVLAAALRRQGVGADLCIGIVDVPFAAHAWVEANGFVLNETLGKRLRFTVIGRF